MHQGYIELHACVVHIDDTGRAQVWANNKGPFMLREQLAAVWDVPTEQIRVNPTSIGGDFGGKGSFMDVPLCYHLARRSGRPVKMVMDYIQELMAGNPRHPAIITMKTGVTRDGRILAHQVRVVFNSGAYGAFKPRVYIRGADHSGGPYPLRSYARAWQAAGGLRGGVPYGYDGQGTRVRPVCVPAAEHSPGRRRESGR